MAFCPEGGALVHGDCFGLPPWKPYCWRTRQGAPLDNHRQWREFYLQLSESAILAHTFSHGKGGICAANDLVDKVAKVYAVRSVNVSLIGVVDIDTHPVGDEPLRGLPAVPIEGPQRCLVEEAEW